MLLVTLSDFRAEIKLRELPGTRRDSKPINSGIWCGANILLSANKFYVLMYRITY
jgi:hypothetical protein